MESMRVGPVTSLAFLATVLTLAVWSAVPERTNAAGIVGTPRSSSRTSKPADDSNSQEQLRQKYHRPTGIPFPASNPYTIEKVVLGKKLFFDPRLSASTVLSCGSCHNPGFGWGDGRARAVGHGMKTLARRSPSILNAAWGAVFMWDGRFATLEEQVLGPIQSTSEMNMPIGRLVDRLQAIEGYRELFRNAFPDQPITAESVARALAAYVRTVVSGRAPFDDWIEGREEAISAGAKRGFALFNSKGLCAECHSGWNFTDDSFHDIGLKTNDPGRARYLPHVVRMQHAFKTPGLREIASRGPFMHDGSLSTLEAVIEHYDRGGIDRPSRSEHIRPLALSEGEKADLVAFLKTLSSNQDHSRLPVMPR